jgi:formylglycine-generating enzyme required for sulfatase activity
VQRIHLNLLKKWWVRGCLPTLRHKIFNKEHIMKHLSLLSTAVLAVVFALPAHAGGKKHPAAPQASTQQASAPAASSGLNPEMVKIPAGSFMMGSNQGQANEQPVHRVSINYDFEMGKTEVTQGLWKAVMGNNPSRLHCEPRTVACQSDNNPVETVSWEDIQLFIAELNAQTGKTYRLPSEAEWEYACLAGNNSDTYCGGNSPVGVAWFDINSERETHPVATKRANAWGLYDMSGNVYEWVQDYYSQDYNGAPDNGRARTSPGNGKFGSYHVVRGGSWYFKSQDLRAANRYGSVPS